MNAQNTPTASTGPAAAQMKIMQYFMPFMLLIFFNSFAAGLTAYIFFSNLIRMTFQFVSNKFIINHKKLRKEIDEHKKKPKIKKGTLLKMKIERSTPKQIVQQPRMIRETFAN